MDVGVAGTSVETPRDRECVRPLGSSGLLAWSALLAAGPCLSVLTLMCLGAGAKALVVVGTGAATSFVAALWAVSRWSQDIAFLANTARRAGWSIDAPEARAHALGVTVLRDVVATVIGIDPALPGGGRVLVVLSDRTRERAIERTRTDFIANASHELRTPLTSLIGFIETLRGPAADEAPAQARFLGIMAEQAARMNRLIDDLLSLSRIEISEHQAPQSKVDAASVLARVADGFEPRVAARGQHLSVIAPEMLPFVLADEDQLVQVIENLLDNACKYGRQDGRIEVVARTENSSGVPHRAGVSISVTNDGAGIAKVHLPRLTERFYRAEAGRPRGPEGTGLGLAIVKHIVNRHRGTLRIESEPGQGATFRIWLPAA